jgi:uncharacterized protein
MPRPCKRRRVICRPQALSFGPAGTPAPTLEAVSLTRDELEALRLADYEGLYQEQAAAKMKISRQTFGNIVGAARNKVADFLVNGKRLSIEGGAVEVDRCRFVCAACGHAWSVSRGAGRPAACPRCNDAAICCEKKISMDTNNQTCWRMS